MKVLRKAFYVDGDLIEQCKVLMDSRNLEVITSEAIPLRLTDRKTSLSLKEFEIIKNCRGGSLKIDLDDIVGIEYSRISSNSDTFLKLFGDYVGKNSNIYNVYLKTRSKTHKLILTQRDLIKLRNYVLKSLHGDK
ncbi:MAG: hypothetical protein RMH77_00535 [Sulfolobales archaeon]|nr:hypothetical protein [Sulfolobales archaeon]MCX8186381.1 hypothetical protein [Sulfolobales archaeon]MDW7968884.1 hypothetical protein [Sulfolobales archaeon]